jgi:hypothetical protein
MDNLIPMLKELLLQIQGWVQTAAPVVWGIAYKKTLMDILTQSILGGIGFIALLIFTVWAWKNNNEEIAPFSGVFCVASLVVFILGITRLIAIDYYTILNIQNLITGIMK